MKLTRSEFEIINIALEFTILNSKSTDYANFLKEIQVKVLKVIVKLYKQDSHHTEVSMNDRTILALIRMFEDITKSLVYKEVPETVLLKKLNVEFERMLDKE